MFDWIDSKREPYFSAPLVSRLATPEEIVGPKVMLHLSNPDRIRELLEIVKRSNEFLKNDPSELLLQVNHYPDLPGYTERFYVPTVTTNSTGLSGYDWNHGYYR